MPLTALLDSGLRTTSIEISDEVFDELRGNPRRNKKFFCQFCHSEMHPKRITEHGTKFFAHNPGAECSAPDEVGGESVEHLAIKGQLIKTINAVDGWRAEAEVWVNPNGRHSFVADVMATPKAKNRRPWTFEVQLSRQSRSWAAERTRDRETVGYVNWMTLEPQSWSLDVPSLIIDPQATQIVGGIFEFGEYQDELVPVGPMDLHAGIGTMLADRYRWIETVGWTKTQAPRRPGRRPRPVSLQGVPEDDCDRDPIEWQPNDGGGAGRGHFSESWGSGEWAGRARQAAARQAARVNLDAVDIEALRRFPEPQSIFDPLDDA